MKPNINSARDHLRLLIGDDTSPVTWQVYYDPKDGLKKPELAQHFVGTLDDNLAFFEQSQNNLCGVYIGVNATDGQGRKEHNVIGYRAVFADFDGMVQPSWDITPSFVTQRDDTHGHAYWLVSDITTADEFRTLQKTIQLKYGTDKQVVDPCRVLRVCGFNHYKNPQSPQQYSISKINSTNKYSQAELLQAFTLNAQQDTELRSWLNSRDGLQTGSGYEHNERYSTQFTNWIKNTAPVAIQGSGTETVIRVASYAHDHGIPLAETQQLMWEHYNPRCIPQWTLNEKQHFNDTISNAFKYSTSAAGCKTVTAVFSHLPPAPERTDGFVKPEAEVIPLSLEKCEKTTDIFIYRLSYTEAAVSLSALTEKSTHYDLARAFDGIEYNGERIIRVDKIFYVYSGSNWQVSADEVVKAAIHTFYRDVKPSDKFTRGVYNVFCDLVTHDKADNGTFLNNSKRDTRNLTVFKNFMVDVAQESLKTEPHDLHYFNFNSLDYDYNPRAECPLWMEFLNQLFPKDPESIECAQQWFGYCMTSDTSFQKYMNLIGKSRGGKGVFTEILRSVVGTDNTVAPSLSAIIKDSALDVMATKSVAIIPDAHSVHHNQRDNVLSQLKAITGNDPISFHRLYKGTKTAVMPCRITLVTNNMPEFLDPSGALANRMLVLYFKKSFEGKEDVNLLSKLQTEKEGIAQWGLRALPKLHAQGRFTESKAGQQEKEDLREDMFPLAQFVSSKCILEAEAVSCVDELFNVYRLWASQSGVRNPMAKIHFCRVLRTSSLPIEAGRYRLNGEQVRGFSGIKLNQSAMTVSSNVTPFPTVEKG